MRHLVCEDAHHRHVGLETQLRGFINLASTVCSAYQHRIPNIKRKQKNGYTFHIIFSDEKLKFVEALNLPTFEWDNRQLVKRLTLAIENAHVIKFWYPVFPPDKNAKSGSVVGE
ncbi:uncharacterized protein K441DRAFT_302877 [Cenococcum geophilum 1.58]|uniref:uncharacterized protein n=1 Tax=Cenococcum geophilum 1.58 TaxID=794803 RepID=UPI00358F43D3|nr:hypothetical protein K441DRAFT_302877 [Cenococcum geophilum 1.58]